MANLKEENSPYWHGKNSIMNLDGGGPAPWDGTQYTTYGSIQRDPLLQMVGQPLPVWKILTIRRMVGMKVESKRILEVLEEMGKSRSEDSHTHMRVLSIKDIGGDAINYVNLEKAFKDMADSMNVDAYSHGQSMGIIRKT